MFQFCEKCHWQSDMDCIESVDCFGQYSHFHNVDSSNPRTWYISPSVCIIFNYFHQCLTVFCIQVLCLLRQVFIPRYFILFVVMVRLIQPLWRTVWRFLKKLKIELPYDPAIPLLRIYPEKTIIQKESCTTMFTAALFTVARTWKQLSVHRQLNG